MDDDDAGLLRRYLLPSPTACFGNKVQGRRVDNICIVPNVFVIFQKGLLICKSCLTCYLSFSSSSRSLFLLAFSFCSFSQCTAQDSSCKVLVTFPSRFAMWGTGKRRAETKKVWFKTKHPLFVRDSGRFVCDFIWQGNQTPEWKEIKSRTHASFSAPLTHGFHRVCFEYFCGRSRTSCLFLGCLLSSFLCIFWHY